MNRQTLRKTDGQGERWKTEVNIYVCVETRKTSFFNSARMFRLFFAAFKIEKKKGFGTGGSIRKTFQISSIRETQFEEPLSLGSTCYF